MGGECARRRVQGVVCPPPTARFSPQFGAKSCVGKVIVRVCVFGCGTPGGCRRALRDTSRGAGNSEAHSVRTRGVVGSSRLCPLLGYSRVCQLVFWLAACSLCRNAL